VKKIILSILLATVLALSACAAQPPQAPTPSTRPTPEQPILEATTETAQLTPQNSAGLPPADIANDEGGPAVVIGNWNYTSYAVATQILEPVVELIDSSDLIRRSFKEFVPRSGQILGDLTSPIVQPRSHFALMCPSFLAEPAWT
jgi:ABC-type transport system substrate-binding protein